jgi:hypothetical protein
MMRGNPEKTDGGTRRGPVAAHGVATPDASLSVRIKRLPPRHRIAHLRALMRSQPRRPGRREQLAALLRAELVAPTAGRERSP